MIITGTLLVCDAWFDLALDYGSSGFTTSLLSALLVELPLALLLFASARRLVRVTVETIMQLCGVSGPGAAAVAGPAVRARPGGVPPGPAAGRGRGRSQSEMSQPAEPLVLDQRARRATRGERGRERLHPSTGR